PWGGAERNVRDHCRGRYLYCDAHSVFEMGEGRVARSIPWRNDRLRAGWRVAAGIQRVAGRGGTRLCAVHDLAGLRGNAGTCAHAASRPTRPLQSQPSLTLPINPCLGVEEDFHGNTSSSKIGGYHPTPSFERTGHGTEKTKKHQAQWQEVHGNSGSARTVFPWKRWRGARGPDRRGPFERGFVRREFEWCDFAQREFGRNGLAGSKTSRSGPFRSQFEKRGFAEHGHDGSDSFGGGLDRSAGQRRGILPVRPFERAFRTRPIAQRKSARSQREWRAIFGRGHGRGHFAGNGFDGRGPFRRGPFDGAAAKGFFAATGASRQEKRLAAFGREHSA